MKTIRIIGGKEFKNYFKMIKEVEDRGLYTFNLKYKEYKGYNKRIIETAAGMDQKAIMCIKVQDDLADEIAEIIKKYGFEVGIMNEEYNPFADDDLLKKMG